MKLISLLGLLTLVSCSTYLKTVGTRMVSPESQGKFLKGSVDLARLQGSKRYQMDFKGSTTKAPLEDSPVHSGVSVAGELGILKYLDFYVIPSLAMAPSLFGLKYQVLGDPRESAKKGNFSAAITVAGGSTDEERKDEEGNSDIFDGGVDDINLHLNHSDVGLLAGYRWSDSLLHYGNAIFYKEEARGKVTNNSGTLTDADFKYKNSGVILSTGLIWYLKTWYFKVDYSHLQTNWSYTARSYTNSINGGIGFYW